MDEKRNYFSLWTWPVLNRSRFYNRGGCDFFNNNDSTMRRVKLKIRKYKVGDIKFRVKLSPQIESGLSERIELDTGFVKVIMEVVWKIL